MNARLKSGFMIGGMVLSWSIYYTVSKLLVDATGSAAFSGMLLRLAALIFLTVQLYEDHTFGALLRQGKKQLVTLIAIGVFGFLLDLFANLGYAGGSLSTGTALLKTDVLMVNLATVIIYRKKLFASDWLGTLVMIGGVLIVLGVIMSIIGRGHTIYLDNKTLEYEGQTYKAPYKVTVTVDGEQLTKLYDKERGSTTCLGQTFTVTLSLIHISEPTRH